MGRFAKNTAVFSLLTLGSRLTGLLRQSAVAAALGGGRLNDAYLLALGVPVMVYEAVMGGLLSAVLIPVLVRAQERSCKTSAEAWRVASLLTGIVGAVMAVVSIIALLAASHIIGLMTLLEKDAAAIAAQEMAVTFFQFFAPQMFFFGLSAVFMAILNSHERFAVTGAAPIANNCVAIATLFAYWMDWIGLRGLAIGTTAGVAAMALIQVPSLLRLGMPARLLIDFRDPLLRTLGWVSLPVIGISIANLIGTMVRANLLFTEPGGFTAYTFSFILIMVPYGIFAVSIATVTYPAMAREAANGNAAGFRATLSLATRSTLIIMLPIAVGMAVLAHPLVTVLFERGLFSPVATATTAGFLSIYALTILPYSLVILSTRAFYSREDTLTPLYTTIAGVTTAVLLGIALIGPFGLAGIAAASVLGHTVSAFTAYELLRRRVGGIDGRAIAVTLTKATAAAAVMGAVLLAAAPLFAPDARTLDHAAITPLRLPTTDRAGNVVVVPSQQELDQLWPMLQRDDRRIPRVRFDRETPLAIFGPRMPGGSILALQSIETADGAATATVRVRTVAIAATTTSPAARQPASAHLLIAVPGHIHTATVQWQPAPPAAGSRLWQILQGPAAIQLIILTLLGALIYGALAWAMGMRELAAAAGPLRRLFGPRPPAPHGSPVEPPAPGPPQEIKP